MSLWPVGNKFVGVVNAPESELKSKSCHEVWIVDQSGSVGWAVHQMAEDMCLHLGEIPNGDCISVGYFSGVGDYRWWVKGVRLNTQKDYESVASVIRQNARSRNTTCFSEILSDVPQLINDTAPFADSVKLVFMTDGYPVVPSYDREKSAIFKAIKEIKEKIESGLLVAVGDYYNRQLMTEMAQALGATLQHADEIRDFGRALGKIVVKQGKKRTTIILPAGSDAAFAIENGRVVIYSVENGVVTAPTGTSVYFVTSKSDGQPVASMVASKMVDPYQPAYATALLSLQNGDVDGALSILGDVGDVAIVEKLGSAITNKEFGEVESMIQDAATDIAKRFLKGQKKGCVPKDDAFDLIDLLTLLQNDPEARLYPRHKEFKYKRIGRGSKVKDGYPEFKADENVSVPISSLVGNAKELNISVGVNIPGTVELPDEANGVTRESVGLPKVFNSNVFRTYNLIANALPNVTQLPAKMHIATYTKLVEIGAINHQETVGDVAIVHLDAVPACNRVRGNTACSWDDLAKKSFESTVIGNTLKVLRAKLDELDPNKEFKRPVTMTPEQEAFLAACGIKSDGSYAPPMVEEDATDVMKIRTFEIKVAKTSPVTMKDFSEMVKGNKKINFTGEMMMLGQSDMDAMPKSTGAAVQWLNDRITILKDKKRKIDADINARRYAIALGGHWKKYHNTPEAEYTVPVTGFKTQNSAVVTFLFKDDVEKKI